MGTAALDLLRHTELGRRFLLNFLYCHGLNLFRSGLPLAELLRECLRDIRAGLTEDELESALRNAVADLRWHNTHGLSDKVAEVVYRVVDHNTLVGGSYPLLYQTEVSLRGVNFAEMTNSNMEDLANIVEDGDVVNSSRILRGKLPFAWVTWKNLREVCFEGVFTSTEKGKFCTELLALDYKTDDGPVPLFLLEIETALIPGLSVRRPDAFDGIGGRFFKARNRLDAAGPAPHGFTLSLEALASAGPPYASEFCDGAEEHVAYGLRITGAVACSWLDFFNPLWIDVEPTRVDQVIVGRTDVEAALAESIALIEGFL
jgi:hypothetical protein